MSGEITIAVLIAVAILVVAIAALVWYFALRPFVAQMKAASPMLVRLGEQFDNSPDAFKVLKEIQQQFRTDSGSSLRDVVNRLEEASNQSAHAAEYLKVGVEASRLLAKEDREQILKVIVLLDRVTLRLDRLTLKVDHSAATSERIESAAISVADDLREAHGRADAVGPGDHGAAADAASRQTPTEKALNDDE